MAACCAWAAGAAGIAVQHPVQPGDFLAGQEPGVLSDGIARDAPDRIVGNVAAGARMAKKRRCKTGCLLAAFQAAAGVR